MQPHMASVPLASADEQLVILESYVPDHLSVLPELQPIVFLFIV